VPYNVGTPGEVVEWLKALVLKTSDVKASVGSNPTLSVAFGAIMYRDLKYSLRYVKQNLVEVFIICG
jgi:hypothetical protein